MGLCTLCFKEKKLSGGAQSDLGQGRWGLDRLNETVDVRMLEDRILKLLIHS